MNSLSLRFSRLLCGHYSNKQQAQAEPAQFAHINIYFRPLDWSVFDGPGFYSEQSYDHDPWRPYRQGVHRLHTDGSIQIVENFALDQPMRHAGAGFTPGLLKQICADRLQPRCGCAMHFQEVAPGRFSGQLEPGKNCLVPRDGKLTYLISEVVFDQHCWTSRDQGFDPQSDELIWGSEHGPLIFNRVLSCDSGFAATWLNSDEC